MAYHCISLYRSTGCCILSHWQSNEMSQTSTITHVTCQNLDSQNSLTLTITPAFLRNYPVHLSTSHYKNYSPGFDCPDFVRTPHSQLGKCSAVIDETWNITTAGRPPTMPNGISIWRRGWSGRISSLQLKGFFLCLFWSLRHVRRSHGWTDFDDGHMASFHAGMCLLGVLLTYLPI